MSAQINFIVDQYHVSTPVREIIRDRYRKIDADKKRARLWREQRHDYWRAIIKRHNENRGLYTSVMGSSVYLECSDMIQKRFGYTP